MTSRTPKGTDLLFCHNTTADPREEDAQNVGAFVLLAESIDVSLGFGLDSFPWQEQVGRGRAAITTWKGLC